MLEWPERWWQGAGAALPLQARAAAGHLAAAHGHAPFAARGRDQDQADFQQPRLLQRAVQALQRRGRHLLHSGVATLWPLIASILEDGQPFALRFAFVLLSSKQTLSFKFSFRWACASLRSASAALCQGHNLQQGDRPLAKGCPASSEISSGVLGVRRSQQAARGVEESLGAGLTGRCSNASFSNTARLHIAGDWCQSSRLPKPRRQCCCCRLCGSRRRRRRGDLGGPCPAAW